MNHQTLLDFLYMADPLDERELTQKIYASVIDCQITGNIVPLNRLLKEVDYDRISVIHAVAIIRGTFARRGFLSEWDESRLRMVESVKERADNWQTLLLGILTPPKSDGPFAGAFDKCLGIHPTLARV